MKKTKRFVAYIIILSVLSMIGLVLINIFNRQAFRQALQERDEQIIGLARSLDNNLIHEFEDLAYDLNEHMHNPFYSNMKETFTETGDLSELNWPLISMLTDQRRSIAAILMLYEKELASLTLSGEAPAQYSIGEIEDDSKGNITYQTYPVRWSNSQLILQNGEELQPDSSDKPDELPPNGQGFGPGEQDAVQEVMDFEELHLSVVKDNTGKYYMALRVESVYDKKLSYYILIDLEDFYERIVPEPLRDDHWIVFYQENSSLAIQNHKNQAAYLVMDQEAFQDRQDGYSYIVQCEADNTYGAITYRYANARGTKVRNRLVILPSTDTMNQYFAIGIARDSENFYKEYSKAQMKHFVITLFLVFLGGGFTAIVIKSVTDSEKLASEKSYLERENKLIQELTLAQLQNSTSQMQPHFMYNALSSIRELIYEDPDYAEEMLYDFTTYLRGCIRAMANKDMISFEEEIKNINAYANIEKMRIGDQLKLIYEIEDKDFMIAPFVIQPLVENSIRHGIATRRGKWGTVKISSHHSGQAHVIIVEDDGVGFDYEKIRREVEAGERDSTGLENIIYRLTNLMNATISIDSKPGDGCRITIEIPDQT